MEEFSSTCKCLLSGECKSRRKARNWFDNTQIRYCPNGSNGKFWKYIPNTRNCPPKRSDEDTKKSVPSAESPRSISNHMVNSILDRFKLFTAQPRTFRIKGVRSTCASHNSRYPVYISFDDSFDCLDKTCSLHMDMLDTLDWLDMKTTFFVVTASLRNSSWIAQEFFRRGHTLGSHTHTHINAAVDTGTTRTDIDTANSILRGLVGEEIVNFRAPNLAFPNWGSPAFRYLTETLGYTLWGGINGAGSDWQDYELPYEQWDLYANRTAKLLKNFKDKGPVITLHDRPHSLRTVERYALRICEVCPQCTFEALPRSGKCKDNDVVAVGLIPPKIWAMLFGFLMIISVFAFRRRRHNKFSRNLLSNVCIDRHHRDD